MSDPGMPDCIYYQCHNETTDKKVCTEYVDFGPDENCKPYACLTDKDCLGLVYHYDPTGTNSRFEKCTKHETPSNFVEGNQSYFKYYPKTT